MKIIKRVIIENFRSLKKIDISPTDINVFSGLNDTGKSNVLKALNLFFNDETDFLTSLKFSQDFSKIALASAQKARKQKQQIKIRVYLEAPNTFTSLRDKEIFLEKVFDRAGNMTSNYSDQNIKIKSQITRLFNKVRFYYIPALKGPDVIKSLLGKIGEHQLISADEISKLNEEVNKNLSDLKNILDRSEIKTKTTMGFPVLVRDFWERLTVNTRYDEFDDLQKKTRVTKKGKEIPLKDEFYQIPLELRGEGIKSKYIPPLLKWIQQRKDSDFYIWGVDEPENSLEFRKAEEVAELYFNNYAVTTQLFLTTHSFAFIFASSKKLKNSTFRCVRESLGQTGIESLENLFIKQNRAALADEIGALEIQKELFEEWQKKDTLLQSQEIVIKKLEKGRKPVLLVEGVSDKDIIGKAWKKLYDENAPFEVEVGGGGSGYLKNFVKNPALKITNRKKIVALWDCDCRALGDFMDLWDKNNFEKISAVEVKHKAVAIWRLLLPTPQARIIYTDLTVEKAQLQFLEIEHYFGDDILKKAEIIEQTLSNGIHILKDDKTGLIEILNDLEKKDFENFVPLFNKLKFIYDL